MKRRSLLFVYVLCVCLLQGTFTAQVTAQDQMASGTWILPPVRIPSRDKGAALWTSLELIQEQQLLTGFMVLSNGQQHNVSRQLIQNGSVTNNSICFTVGAGATSKVDYEGKILGDHIYGFTQIHSTSGGPPLKGQWEATRTIFYGNQQNSSLIASNRPADAQVPKQSINSNDSAKPSQ